MSPDQQSAELRDMIERNPKAYMIIGDTDKPFHRPECECKACEAWRTQNNRPTHAELEKKISEG